MSTDWSLRESKPSGNPNVKDDFRCHGTNIHGERCGRPAITGKQYCQFHGGKQRIAAMRKPGTPGKKYDKYMPASLIDKYNEAMDDPDLISLRDSIALVDARIKDTLSHFDEMVPEKYWRDFQSLWADFMFAIRTNDTVRQTVLVRQIDAKIQETTAYANMWDELTNSLDLHRKLVDTEYRRLNAMKSMMPIDEVMRLLATVTLSMRDAVYKYSDDRTATRVIGHLSEIYRKTVIAQSNHLLAERADDVVIEANADDTSSE